MTQLSKLSDHEWQIAKNRWSRGQDWFLSKVGRKWQSEIGDFPLFTTKTAAYDAVTAVVLAEARLRIAA